MASQVAGLTGGTVTSKSGTKDVWLGPSAFNVSCAAADYSVEIPTAEARSCVRFTVVPTGPAQQAIVVEAVADGSSAAQSGIQRGMKLTAISDPVRRDDVWELQVKLCAAADLVLMPCLHKLC